MQCLTKEECKRLSSLLGDIHSNPGARIADVVSEKDFKFIKYTALPKLVAAVWSRRT